MPTVISDYIILLDLGMLGMSGYEIAQRIRSDARGERTTMIAATGWGQELDRERSRDTRMYREPGTGRILGEGIRLDRFRLDPSEASRKMASSRPLLPPEIRMSGRSPRPCCSERRA
jgi:CheY-like chemotaxis protein